MYFCYTTLLAVDILFVDVDGRLSTLSDGYIGVQQYRTSSIDIHVFDWLRCAIDHNSNCNNNHSIARWSY